MGKKSDAGTMITPAYLYDKDGKQIGFTNYDNKAIAYAMANHERVEKAETFDAMFGKVTVERKSFSASALEKVKGKKKYGEHLLFLVGAPLVVNK